MSFYEWMQEQEELSEASVSKYDAAIRGVLSDWANEAKIVERSLLDIRNPSEFAEIIAAIKALPIFKKRDSAGNQMYGAAMNKYAKYLHYVLQQSVETDIEDILADQSIQSTDRAQIIHARIGQGKYRRELIDLWGCCCVTGYSDVSILMASHIKPWSQSSNTERLDRYNGLLLLPNLDKAFDAGLISFDASGGILLSARLYNPEELGINSKMSVSLKEQHLSYIKFHRENIYLR